MKFCYLDESGMGNEPVLVMAGILVDAHRMHVTKGAWEDFLRYLSQETGRTINEFHSRDFYRGNGPWRNVAGPNRAKLISAIIRWIETRKHNVVFSALLKDEFTNRRSSIQQTTGADCPWCAAAMHCILSLQKHNQSQEKNKGHTVVIFDREVKKEGELSNLIHSPLSALNEYYGKKPKHPVLDQIVDVPYFADSEHVLLLQVADVVAYVLRTYADLEVGALQEQYPEEKAQMKAWVDEIIARALPGSTRYPARGRCEIADLFWNIAPACLRR
jgi:hypothetical protein